MVIAKEVGRSVTKGVMIGDDREERSFWVMIGRKQVVQVLR